MRKVASLLAQALRLRQVYNRPRIMASAFRADLETVAASAAAQEGVVWTLGASEDLNVNLVRFGVGQGVGEHVNDEVDVLFLGVSGSGVIEVDGQEHALSEGALIFVPRGARRSTWGVSEDFAYLTVHKKRGPLRISRRT